MGIREGQEGKLGSLLRKSIERTTEKLGNTEIVHSW